MRRWLLHAPRHDGTREVTPLDWMCVTAIQAVSMISILSTAYIFSTAVFMVKFWGAEARTK